MRAADGLAQRVRRDPRPRRRRLSAGPRRCGGPGRAPLPAGHDGAGDQLGHARRVDHRARRAADRPLAPRGRALHHPSPLAHRLRRRPRVAAPGAVRERRGAGEPRLRARVRLRPAVRRVGVHRAGLPRGAGHRLGQRSPSAPELGHEPGRGGPARHRAYDDEGGRHAVRGAVLVRAPAAEELRRGLRAAGVDRPPLAALARPRRVSRPPLAHLPPAQRAHAEGTVLRTDRRLHGGGHDLAPRDAGRRAQLGLPLHLDPRLHVRALGHVHARLRLGGKRLLLLHRRRGRGRGGPATDHVRHRRRVGAGGGDAGPPHGLRGRPPRARRQRRVQPGAARRMGRRARLLLPAHQVARPPARADLADPGEAGGGRPGALEGARPRPLGGARRARSTSPRPS